MERAKLSDMTNGWWLGNFTPAFYQTDDVEVGYKHHRAGESYAAHYQRQASEYNLLVRGLMIVNGERFVDGDLFSFAPGEVCTPQFITDCEVVCVKIPSLPGDKVEC